jgi:uncharacterized protein YggE
MAMTVKIPGILSSALLVIMLVFPLSGWPGEDEEDRSQLTVSAEGKIDVPPDKAELNFAVETVGEKLSKVQQENQERLARVLKECRTLNIPPQFIQTTSLTVIPEYPPPPRHPSDESLENTVPRIIGYRVIHHVNVEVHNLEIVGKVVDQVLKVGANRFSGISWGVQNEQPLKLEVLKQASAKAMAKAETLAEALHLRLVRLTNVMEGDISPSPPEGRYRFASTAMAVSGDRELAVSAGEISLRGTVTLVYEISQK